MKKISLFIYAGLALIIQSCVFNSIGETINNGVAKDGDLQPGIIFPADNPWNKDIYDLEKDPASDQIMKNEIDSVPFKDGSKFARVEFSMPFYIVNHAPTPITIRGLRPGYDNGDYRLPVDTQYKFPELKDKAPQISDFHVCIIDTGTRKLYELYRTSMFNPTEWTHNGAAVFDLKTNLLHSEDGYTSSDAAGLPVVPGLLRVDELESGKIQHALRITVKLTLEGHVYPATHHARTKFKYNPAEKIGWLPLGARIRLKRDFDTTGYSPQIKVIIECLKHYGAYVADIGTHFAITGTDDKRFATYPGIWYYPDETNHGGESMRFLSKDAKKEIMWSDFEVLPLGKISTVMY